MELSTIFTFFLHAFDKPLFLLMILYDKAVYSPLQRLLSPLIAGIPRDVHVAGRSLTLFTANFVTLGRTVLVVPVAICLKSHWNVSACLLIVFHDFLDHVDGIVAKVHRSQYGLVDNPLLGSFLDAFCDKVVNVFTLWTVLVLVDLQNLSFYQTLVFVGVSSSVILYETVLGVVRVQDYFHAVYANIQASMEGKVKEKLESVGLALFCLSLKYHNPMDSWECLIGCVCLLISVRFAHQSLVHKLKLRKSTVSPPVYAARQNPSEVEALTLLPGSLQQVCSAPNLQLLRDRNDSESSEERGENRVDKVYTIGCFDLLHRGHETLFRNMRKLGREVIVGVHNDESYFKLKKKKPIDNTEKRMENVKKYADQVFVVSSTDPSPYIQCCVHLKPGETALYVRGDDMPQFPGRRICEQLMSIQLLPYTQGVSSTALRAQLLAGYQNGSCIRAKSD